MTKDNTPKTKAGEIKANIEIKQLILDSDLQWKLKMIIGKTLEISYHRYTVKMVFNDEPYAIRIADIKKENKLIPSETKEAITKLPEATKDA